MKILKQSMIDGKKAKLLLLDDNNTLKVTLENKVISILPGVWENLKEEDWAQSGTLEIEVTEYLKNKREKEELEAISKKYF